MAAIVCKCINKIRNGSDQIKGYVLLDEYGNTVTIEADKLKRDIRGHRIKVVNLQFDALGRLINKKEIEAISKESNRLMNNRPSNYGHVQNVVEPNEVVTESNVVNSEERNIAMLKDRMKSVIANCGADDIQEYTHGYSFTRWCHGGNDYDDETCSIQCKGDKFIVSSHSSRGTDVRNAFVNLSEAIKKLENSPGF